MQVTDENLIVLEVRNLIMSMLESTITLPHLWGRTVGKAAKTEPLALRPAFKLTIEKLVARDTTVRINLIFNSLLAFWLPIREKQ